MSFLIKKISGHTEAFDPKKFERSLKKAGAEQKVINQLIKDIEHNPELRSTKKIYAYALDKLHKYNPPTAGRYNAKQALLELGPAGFPFELFVAHIFKAEGYSVVTGQTIDGFCIDHEIDVVAQNKTSHCMIECKYHNRQRLKTDVKVALYIKARFDDVTKIWKNDKHATHESWIVTNTKFTSKATQYSECVGIKLLSWNYPHKKSLIGLIQKHRLHPITCLTSLNKKDKETFVKHGLVLCKDAHKHEQTLKSLELRPAKIKKIVQEAQGICSL